MRVGMRVGPFYTSSRVTGAGCLPVLLVTAGMVVLSIVLGVGNRYPAATGIVLGALAAAGATVGIYALVRHEKRANARRAADPYCRARGPASWTAHPGRPHLCAGRQGHGAGVEHACVCGWRWA